MTLFFFSVMTENQGRPNNTSSNINSATVTSNSTTNNNDNDLIIGSPEIPRKIDCGPKLANLRRYWRDYYVEPSRASLSSNASDDNSECAAILENGIVKVRFFRIFPVGYKNMLKSCLRILCKIQSSY